MPSEACPHWFRSEMSKAFSAERGRWERNEVSEDEDAVHAVRINDRSIGGLIALAQKNVRLLLVCALLGFVVATAYALAIRSVYTSSASLVIDARNAVALDDRTGLMTFIADDRTVQTQIELLKSDQVLARVVDTLTLTTNSKFLADVESGAPSGIMRQMVAVAKSLLGRSAQSNDGINALRTQAIATIQDNLLIKREPFTYVISIFYSSHSPTLSAEIANAVVDGYMKEQSEARSHAAKQADNYLRTQIEDVRSKLQAADKDVEMFQKAHGLVQSGGTSLFDQQMVDLTARVGIARSEQTTAEIKWRRALSFLGGKNVDSIASEAGVSSLFDSVVRKYMEIGNQERIFINQYGKDNPTTVRLGQEKENLARLLFAEFDRHVLQLSNEQEIAQSKVDTLEAELKDLTEKIAEKTSQRLELARLEQVAGAYRDAYRADLGEYSKKMQELLSPINDARLINTAKPPRFASSPRRLLLLFQGFMFGCVIGAIIVGFREMRQRAR
jgi:succinoglycan biosynthesis transport protein ExoP